MQFLFTVVQIFAEALVTISECIFHLRAICQDCVHSVRLCSVPEGRAGLHHLLLWLSGILHHVDTSAQTRSFCPQLGYSQCCTCCVGERNDETGVCVLPQLGVCTDHTAQGHGLPPIPRVLHAQAWRDWTPFHRVSSLLCFLFIFCLWFYLYFSSKSMYFHKFQAFVYFFTNITFYGFSDFWGLFCFFSTFCCDVLLLLLFWFS